MAGAPPIFDVGEVLDLRYDGLPDRVKIYMVYKKERSTCWMYCVLSEQANGYVFMTENHIFKHHSQHKTAAYNDNMVQQLLFMGYRFVSNTSKAKCNILETLCSKKEIAEVIKARAVYPDGTKCTHDNDHGIWIKYNTVITLDGHYGDVQFTRIK